MKLKNAILAGSAALAAMVMAAPASAAVYTYGMSGNGTLTINTTTKSGTWKAPDFDVQFTSNDFANFTGGLKPNFTAILDQLTGTYTVGGKVLTPNPKGKFDVHPQKLIFNGTSTVNLWAWWGNPISAGDYIKHIRRVNVTHPGTTSSGGTPVSEPGMLGLFALGLMGLWAGGRRRRVAPAGMKLATA